MDGSLFARLSRLYGDASLLSRRRMLGATAAASAVVLLSAGWSRAFGSAAGHRGKQRVVVVGAGFSGLACAFELHSAGYDVTIIEARSRVGGRVLTLRDLVKGKTVEGGGELIGTNHPTWEAYRQRFDLKFVGAETAEDLAAPILLRGKVLSREEGEKLYADMDAILAAITEDARAINADEPWRSENAAKLDATSMAERLMKIEGNELARYAVGVQLASDNGASLNRQSYLGILAAVRGGGLERYWTDSESQRCAGGNQQLAERLAGGIGAERILLSSPVRAVRSLDAGPQVELVSGRKIDADDVVVALPPSVWSTVEFEPKFPRELAPSMGVAAKYLAGVRDRFWLRDKKSADAFGDEGLSMVWDGTERLDPKSNEAEKPNEEVPACLVGFAGGPALEKLRAESPGDKKNADLLTPARAACEKLYPGVRASLLKERFMDWPSDPLTKGGYSFPAPGEVTTIGPRLREGLGRVHFAGEHCCYQFAGYMEGALHSGVSLAKKLAVRDGRG